VHLIPYNFVTNNFCCGEHLASYVHLNVDLPEETDGGLHKIVVSCSEVRRQISVKLNHLTNLMFIGPCNHCDN